LFTKIFTVCCDYFLQHTNKYERQVQQHDQHSSCVQLPPALPSIKKKAFLNLYQIREMLWVVIVVMMS